MVAPGSSFPSASRRLLLLFFLATLFSSGHQSRRLEETNRDEAFIGYSERRHHHHRSSSKSSVSCVDESLMCPEWAANGECDSKTNREFMAKNCCCGARLLFSNDLTRRTRCADTCLFLLLGLGLGLGLLRTNERKTQRVTRNVHYCYSRKKTTTGLLGRRREKKKRLEI